MRCYLGTIGIVFLGATGVAAAGPPGGGGAVVRDHRSAGDGGGRGASVAVGLTDI